MKSNTAAKQGSKEKQSSLKTAKPATHNGSSTVAPTGSATQKAKAKSGHGLTNEGTNVSYEGER